MKLGIDFGTSFSTMAYCNPVTGRPEVISDDSGLTKIPTLVYWGQDGDVKVGQAALDLLGDTELMPPEAQFEIRTRIIKSVKILIGKDMLIPLPDGTTISPAEVVSCFLGYLKAQAEKRIGHGHPFDEVTLTHPSSFTNAQKRILENAAQDAGFKRVCLLEEPISAALGYAHSNVDPGNSILVYDLGGGTFDLAFVVRDEDGEYRLPIPTMGDPDCGGDNFDAALYNYLEQRLPDGQKFKDNPDEFDLSVLYECRKLKESISKRERAGIRIWTERIRFQKMVERTEFEGLIKPYVENSINYLERMLGQIRDSGFEVGSLIMIGGSSRIPFIRRMLGERLNLNPLETSQDDVAVALGAAVDLEEIRRKRDEERQRAIEFEKVRVERERQEKRQAEQKAMEAKLEEEKRRILERQEEIERQAKEDRIQKAARNMELADAAYSKREFGEAIHRFRDAAEQGDARAQYMLGEIYRAGSGVNADVNEAVKWFEKSAMQGHFPAMYPLGMAYVALGQPQKACKWFEAADKHGDIPSTYQLGKFYKEGTGEGHWGRDLLRAEVLLKKAASAEASPDNPLLRESVANACYHYALLLEAKGVPETTVETWMKRASSFGSGWADIWTVKKEAKRGLNELGNKFKKWLG